MQASQLASDDMLASIVNAIRHQTAKRNPDKQLDMLASKPYSVDVKTKTEAEKRTRDFLARAAQSAEDERREELNWEQAIHDANMERDDYHLREEGRNPDGSGESYAERNL